MKDKYFLDTNVFVSSFDSMIITAAVQTNCSILYSEDLQHGQIIQDLTIINPFKKS